MDRIGTLLGIALAALVLAGVGVWLAVGTGSSDEADEGGGGAAKDHHVGDTQDPHARFPERGFPIARVRPRARVRVLNNPRGKVVESLDARTEFGSPRVFSVVEPGRRWLGVIAPELGNGRVGWISYRPGSLILGSTQYSIRVDLSARRVELRRGDELVHGFTVTVGRFGSNTPTGRFAVTDGITRGLSPVYGCCAVALSARQPNPPPGWFGGDRIAIHGWRGPIGEATSGGCLRATNRDMRALISRVTLGAPVFIRS